MFSANHLFGPKCPYYGFVLKFINLLSWRRIVPNQSLIYIISSAICLCWVYIQLWSKSMYILIIVLMHLQPYMTHTIYKAEMSKLANRSEILRIITESFRDNLFTFWFFLHPGLAISDIWNKIWTMKHINSIF